MAGYSKNPLEKKLGIKPGFSCLIINEPDDYGNYFETLPEDLEFYEMEDELPPIDFVHYFETKEAPLQETLDRLKRSIKKDGMIWASWLKLASKQPSEITDAQIHEAGRKTGLVDVKVCAVSDDWSGMKFMYRKTDR